MEQIVGYIERITFHNPENGYTVAKLKPRNQATLVCIVGSMPSVQPGETVRCCGNWKQHLTHGRQFEVEKYQIEAPADVEGIRKYLGSGLIAGIGPVYAQRIVDTFGEDTLNIIDSDPSRLKEVEGIGKKRLEMIIGCWQDQRGIREVMIFLQSHGVSSTYAQKIYKVYGPQTISRLKENPYRLARDIFGIGFRSADKVALEMDIAKESPKRIDAGVEYVLQELSNDGHTCYPVPVFLDAAEQILEVNRLLIEERLAALVEEKRIALDKLVASGTVDDFIWIRALYLSEKGIGHEVRRLIRSPCYLREIDAKKAIDWVQEKLNIELAPKQKDAVVRAVTDKMHIITGGPGTGKSTITNAILAITRKLTNKILLAAPTGRAAKRMSEITGHQASTIHSLLEFDFKTFGFKRKRENPLDCDLLIIDEASMIDTSLMYSLLKAIPSHARLILVGDIYQLPSVGPGNVLKDMIASRCVPVTMLTEIFRQAEGSQIVVNAHRINAGKMPHTSNLSDGDFFFIQSYTPEDILKEVISLVKQRLIKKYGFNPKEDIQVLAPMKKGLIGIDNLNIILQEELNPQKEHLFRSGKKLQVGDKVMQIRNNYRKEVYNGDIGYIQRIDNQDQKVVVAMMDKEVLYDFAELDELVLAYAVSIHKYQGSETPCVIIPVHTTHFKLLHRNLLYTGVTRGKKLVILVGTKKALAIAVNNDEVKSRYTGLQEALFEGNTQTLVI
ncbi:MAG: ATP-dependent RecD-like DNA helicase [Chlamydiales bacterium]|nr:ATP-dependent RecD-like DNA helicase [Chlamydiia bacterium]MCP5508645.1 ATP-dependent RecD-like DNA helicase [Chlamydiales bacterium]